MFNFFLIGLYLLNLPPFRFYFVNVQHIFAAINIVIFLYILLSAGKRKILISKIAYQKNELFFLSCLFIAISISVAQSLDATLFLEKYMSVFVSSLFYINLIYFDNKIYKHIYSIIMFWIAINLANELLMVFNTSFYLTVFSNLLNEKGYTMAKDVILKSRLTISTYTEIFLPILYWKYFSSRNNKVILYVSIILINILAFYSGWRIRGIISIISIVQVIYMMFYQNNFRRLVPKLGLLILPFSILFLVNSGFFTKNPTLNRILYDSEDAISSDKNRTNILSQSFDIFFINPLFGVGLNNNYIYRQNPKYLSSKEANNSAKLVREAGSHNFYIDLLIEVGLFGIVFFLIVLLSWIKEDKKYIVDINRYPFISAFYLLLFYAILHSTGGYRFFTLILLLRSSIKNS